MPSRAKDNKAKDNKANNKKPTNKARNIFFLILCLLILGVFSRLIVSQAASYNDLRAIYNRIQSELDREVAIYEDLRYQMAHFDSDAYIEALARNRLGWVMPNEIALRKVTD